MYQDASNAKQPQAANNLGKAAGSFYGPAYGTCTWDATHDVGPCVNEALAAAASGGGTVTLPPGIYGLSTKIVWPANGGPVGLRCAAGTGAGVGSRLKWIVRHAAQQRGRGEHMSVTRAALLAALLLAAPAQAQQVPNPMARAH